MKYLAKMQRWCPGWIGFSAMIVLLALAQPAPAGEAEQFIGDYTGGAEVVSADGSREHRNMAVTISETKEGFTVQWTSVIHKSDGRVKENTFSIDFLPSDREGIFSAAMGRSLFGQAVPLDPMKGEPYVWGRIVGDTMSVFSLFISDDGGYEMQQYDRTLAEGGLQLDFSLSRNGEQQRSVSTFLERQ